MRWGWGLLASVAFAPVHAADVTEKPIIAPAAAWVIPAVLPKDASKPDEAAIRLLLSDQQVRLTKDGQDIYTETLIRVQTPQGLQALGNITLPWKPDTSTLTVHRLRILRGPQVIDLLKDGPGFTVLRRENRLEYATLDGVLTAVIQPEGLQVGDVVDIAITIASRDPVLAGHPEGSLGGWANVPVDHVRSRAIWDDALPIRWRATDDVPAVRETKRGGTTEISLAADGLAPILYPKDAPQRFRLPRLVEASAYKSWADLSALFAPLYAKAAAIAPGSQLAVEIDRIAASTKDPVARAEAALALAQDRVRYVFLGMNDGGLMPAAADTTWQRRFGDCKGKTALLVGMLHALGIAAEPAIVSTGFGDGLDQRLPMVGLFDHILVRATIAGKTYWLDGTRMGDRRLADVVVPPFHWALPVRPSGATLERLVQEPATRPFATTDIRMDASKGLSVPAAFHAETVLRGDGATQLKLNLANLTPEQRDRGLRDYWTGRYDFLTVKNATATYDDKSGEERLAVDGTAVMDWASNAYEADGVGVGWVADFARPDGPHKDAPFAVAFPAFERTTETILLPNAGKGFSIDTPDVDRTVAGIAYHRKARLSGANYMVELTSRTMTPEFPASDAAGFQATLRELHKQRVFLNRPKQYAWTIEERDAAVAKVPTTPGEMYARAGAHLQRAEWRDAITYYTKYLEAQPKDAGAFAWRAGAHMRLGEFAEADADYDRASALDPAYLEARLGKARVAAARQDWRTARDLASQILSAHPQATDALAIRVNAAHRLHEPATEAADKAAFAKVSPPIQIARLEIDVDNFTGAMAAVAPILARDKADPEALWVRMRSEWSLGRYNKALADNATLLSLRPQDPDLYLQRLNIFKRLGRNDEVLRTLTQMTAAMPDNDHAHVIAGAAFAALQRRDDAMAEFAKAIAIRPSVNAYLTRAENRPWLDTAGREADVEAALRMEPLNIKALTLRMSTTLTSHQYAKALSALEPLLKQQPASSNLLNSRGIAHAGLGQLDLAKADFIAARAAASDADGNALNNLCWDKATHGMALDEALLDCEAGLKRRPKGADLLDSKAFVLLRLGRYQEAISAYDAALQEAPKQAESLYGRGMAKVKLGQAAQGNADLAAARAIAPKVDEGFRNYGITV